MTSISKSADTPALIQIDGSCSRLNHVIAFSLTATKPRLTQAAAIRPMNRRSPRVVAIGSQPRRRGVGDRISPTVMPTSISTMQVKNTATGSVQAIHSNMFSCLRQQDRGSYTPHGEALGDVVAHEPDHD